MALADKTFGNADGSISDHLKASIVSTDKMIAVTGLIGPGTSRSLQANWNSPFEQSSVGSMFDKVGGLIQAVSGRLLQDDKGLTSVTTFNSTQIWDGNRPISLNLVLIFYALSDAEKEVTKALAALEVMASPELRSWIPIGGTDKGRIPGAVTLKMGGVLIPNMVIESISTPLDKGRDRNGNLLHAEVNVILQTKTTLNKADIAPTWGVTL